MESDRPKTFVVSVDEQHQDQLDKIAEQLKNDGFEQTQSLEAIGVLIGSAPESAIPKLKMVEGVAFIEEERDDYRASSPAK